MPSPANRLSWYANRLRAMGPAEVLYRLGEAAKRRTSGFRTYGWSHFAVDGARLPFIAVDKRQLARLDGDIRTAWRKLAPKEDHAGLFQALGQDFAIKKNIDWHQDPVSQIRWPADDFCFRIPYRHDRQRGDVKLVWELNRLQFVPVIAATGVLDQDDTLIQTSLDLIESWIDANPPFKGINWVSGIELALRVVSILLTIGLVGQDRIEPALARKLAGCLAAHFYWLRRYPSRFSSANNHLIAEAAAVFILGSLWPEHGESDTAADEARATLSVEIFRQFHDDGVGAEQSPTYAAFSGEWYALAFAVAGQVGRPFPDEVVAQLGRAGDCLRWFLDAAGNHPRIGDDDEGRVISSGTGHEPHYVASVVNSIAAAAYRPDIAVASNQPSLRSAVLGWQSGQVSPEGTRVFSRGGYSVFRKRISGRDALAVLDHGPLGYLSIAAHGHADALAVNLHLDAKPVLVDAGTYLYHSGGATRDRLRGTSAHNTVCVNGQDQSKIAGAFNWRNAATTHIVERDCNGSADRIVARHDGYAQSAGILCERDLTVDETGLTIRDSLVAAADTGPDRVASVEIGFLLHPDLSASIEGTQVVVRRGHEPIMRLTPCEGLLPAVRPAEYSPAFGVMQQATRIGLTATNPKQREFSVRFDIVPPLPAVGLEETAIIPECTVPDTTVFVVERLGERS